MKWHVLEQERTGRKLPEPLDVCGSDTAQLLSRSREFLCPLPEL